ncbi:MAG: hypothetical protein NZM37_00415 [Sandaracinaceae bacterium]|nr:hypothetical protein [Sandaracinaceae bacterium]MDW8245255.1 hypothetical protein [Sandaracinaceae bacterium]
MGKLVEILTNEGRKAQVVKECLDIIEAEVESKGGLSGMAIKAGYKAVKSIRPGFIQEVVEHLLPEFAEAIEPIYMEAKQKAEPIVPYFEKQASRVADALLAITDARAQRSRSGVIKATYERLRPLAKSNVEQAVPRVARLIEKHGS